MNHNLEIQKLLLKKDSIESPEDRINLLKQAIQIADANNDLDWGFDLRLDLIFEERDTAHCIDSFAAFTWLLSTYDSNPETFDESDFLWEYKWMAGAARRNVNISMEQVHSIMDDLKIRMERNGYTLRGYYSVSIYWNLFIGNTEEAKRILTLRNETERDRMSHCPACELDTQVEIELIEGNFDKALSTASDLITKKLTCGVMPLVTFCNLTYYLGKAGDARAAQFFPKAEEEIAALKENDTSLISHVSNLLYYLTLNNKDEAWRYFEKYAEWEVNSEDAVSFDFSKNVLPLLKEANKKELNLGIKLPYYSSDNIYDTEELFQYYYKKANDLAIRFDSRNGTDKFKMELSEVLQPTMN